MGLAQSFKKNLIYYLILHKSFMKDCFSNLSQYYVHFNVDYNMYVTKEFSIRRI